MWKSFVKEQLNSGVFVIPILFIFFEIYLGSCFLVFVLFQERFTNVLKNSDFPLLLSLTVGNNLKKVFSAYFLSWLFWFNLFFIGIIFFETMDFSVFVQRILKYNILFCTSFTLGLYINNSNGLHIQNPFLLRIVTYPLFTLGVTCVYLLLIWNNYIIDSALLDVILFLIIFWLCYYLIRKQQKIRFKENYILS